MGFFDKRDEKKGRTALQEAKQLEAQGEYQKALEKYQKWSHREKPLDVAGDACYGIARILWKEDPVKNYNWAVTYMEYAVERGSERAKAEIGQLYQEVVADCLEQFPLWFNTMGYEVAEDYAKLAVRCGSEEAKTMLKVLEYQSGPAREVAIKTYNQGCIRAQKGVFDQTTFELFEKAAGMGLPEAMLNAVITYYEFPYGKYPTTAFFPDPIGYCREYNYRAGAYRWVRKAILAGNERAREWWFGYNPDATSKRCYQLFGISENSTDYGLKWIPDVLPRLPIPAADFQWPEGTFTYEQARAYLPE